MSIENRKHERVPSDFFVRATVPGEKAGRRIACRNLSLGGAFLEMSEPPARGTAIRLVLELVPVGTSIGLEAEVVWARPEMPDRQFPAGVGVRFINLDDKARSLLEQTVEILQARSTRKNQTDTDS